LVENANRKTARAFLEHLFEAVPQTMPTDKGTRFAERPRNRGGVAFDPDRLIADPIHQRPGPKG